MSKWIHFAQMGDTGKTTIWGVLTKGDDTKLGEVRWFGRWRTYAFFPQSDTVYEPTCLGDIATFIRERMAERKRAPGAEGEG